MTSVIVVMLVVSTQLLVSVIPVQDCLFPVSGQFQRGKVIDGDPIMTMVTKNVYQCNELCHVTTSCVSFSYNFTSKSCTTFSSSLTDSTLDKREYHVINKDVVRAASSSCDSNSCQNHTVCVNIGNSHMCVDQNAEGFRSHKYTCELHGGYSWSASAGICYSFKLNATYRQQAKEMCEQDGGRLIKIDSWKKQQTIAALVLSDPVLDEVGRFWIGADDSQVEGEWRWTDGTLVEHFFWGTGQPSGGTNIDFVVIGQHSGYRWNDRGSRIVIQSVGALCEVRVW